MSQILGNTYTVIRAVGELQEFGATPEQIAALATCWDAPYFNDAERAALALVEAVVRPAAGEEKVSAEFIRAGGRALRPEGSQYIDDRDRPGHLLDTDRADRQAAAGYVAGRAVDVGHRLKPECRQVGVGRGGGAPVSEDLDE